MGKIKNVIRLGVVLAALGVIALTFAGRASAAIAMVAGTVAVLLDRARPVRRRLPVTAA